MQDLFIAVPETTLPNGIVVPSFHVGQFAATKGLDGKAAVASDAAPWVRVNFKDAIKACEAAGYSLITELQWLAIAWDASQQDCNWTKGKVGEGKLFRGIRNEHYSCAQPGNIEPTDKKERRWLTLSTGERICDLNGNVWQWVFDNVQGDAEGLVAKAFNKESPSIATAPYPCNEKGMGWRPSAGANWSGSALVRGGFWFSESSAGAFCLVGVWPGDGYGNEKILHNYSSIERVVLHGVC